MSCVVQQSSEVCRFLPSLSERSASAFEYVCLSVCLLVCLSVRARNKKNYCSDLIFATLEVGPYYARDSILLKMIQIGIWTQEFIKGFVFMSNADIGLQPLLCCHGIEYNTNINDTHVCQSKNVTLYMPVEICSSETCLLMV